MLRFDKATYLSFLFKYILSVILSNSLYVVLLFPEFMNIVSILYYNCFESIILLNTSSVTLFPQCKEYIIWLTSFCTFTDVIPACTCARSIGNPWGICLGVHILKSMSSVGIKKNIPSVKAFRTSSLLSYSALILSRISLFFIFIF